MKIKVFYLFKNIWNKTFSRYTSLCNCFLETETVIIKKLLFRNYLEILTVSFDACLLPRNYRRDPNLTGHRVHC